MQDSVSSIPMTFKIDRADSVLSFSGIVDQQLALQWVQQHVSSPRHIVS